MDNATFRDREFSSHMTINNPGSSSYAGAFFPGASGFIVAGGTFTSSVINNVHRAARSIPSDFRRITWGDIDLRHPIRLDSTSGVAYRERGRGVVRRMYYQAKIVGREADLTVAVYEGDNSEEEWKQEVARYSLLRHPNILQIFGAASLSGMHAIIANDDLVPLRDFLKLYQHLPISTIYIYSFCSEDFSDATVYMRTKFQDPPLFRRCRFWIRRSTNMLCVELPISEVEENLFLSNGVSWSHDTKTHRNDLNQEAKLIDSLELYQYHWLCYVHLREIRNFRIWDAEVEFDVGAVICFPVGSQLQSSVKIAVLADTEMHTSGWFLSDFKSVTKQTMEDGWTRYDCDEVSGQRVVCELSRGWQEVSGWLAQANSVFTQLRIISNHEDYLVTFMGNISLSVEESMHDPPEGYLFICPEDDFWTGPTTFRWPSCPAYWSVDPSGLERLSADEAEHLGFPSIELTTEFKGHSWDSSVYAGLRKFHQGKGFNPDSQDVAKEVGYPLYQLFSEIETPFAHVDREVADEEEEGSDDTTSIHDEDLDVQGSDNHVQNSGGELDQLPAQILGHDFWSIPNFNSSDILGELPSDSLQGASISESLDFTGSGLHHSSFSFPYNDGLETSWRLHPNLDGLGPPSVPANLWNYDAAGLTGTDPFSTSTFLTYPPLELPQMFSSTQAAASISWFPAHPNSPPGTNLSSRKSVGGPRGPSKSLSHDFPSHAGCGGD